MLNIISPINQLGYGIAGLNICKELDNLVKVALFPIGQPQVTNASTTDVEIFQTIPSTTSRGTVQPDWDYALILEEGAQLQSANNTSVFFYIEDMVIIMIES